VGAFVPVAVVLQALSIGTFAVVEDGAQLVVSHAAERVAVVAHGLHGSQRGAEAAGALTLILMHNFWGAAGGHVECARLMERGHLARIGEHTRPRVSSSAPSPKIFGCVRDRRAQQVSGGGTGNSTRAPPAACVAPQKANPHRPSWV
jgi:hypothetical protein